ncbi:trypsin-like serine protease [Conexibacter stalactiti]|uniref:Trypsin-like serine protease n=1 Tax=Conexibacter stalactiti TaxID=1940611 RepID=A0ABU4HUA7_9ACTN|nr:trypsin-like serine protease [Conexibacter stalactiti]MDW5596861.1 trypsin-like serine protease [Conexibacter stalactiti]MEC5037503.1 trypsin-like serine protease [Conexibacter stalactiti]
MNEIRKVAIGALVAGGLLAVAGLAPPTAGAVIDGERVAIADAPWAVSTGRVIRRRWEHFCTATVIGPRRLATARHCVEHDDTWSLLIMSGSDDPRGAPGRRTTVAHVWTPTLANLFATNRGLRSDLAVIETVDELGAPVLPLAPAGTTAAPAEPVFAYGFGNTTDGEAAVGPPLLRRAAKLMHTRAECAESDFGLEPTALCARRAPGPAGGLLGSGDSGGGLVRQGAAGPELLGVNSAVTGGMLGDQLGGFASVPALHDFLTHPERGHELPLPVGRAVIRGRARVGERVRCSARWSQPIRSLDVHWIVTGRAARPLRTTTGPQPWKVPPSARGSRLTCEATGHVTLDYASRTAPSRAVTVTR